MFFLKTIRQERATDLESAADKCEELARTMVVLGAHIESPGQILNAVDDDNRQYIDTLIECEQKMVVSEYVVQQYLKEIWNGQGSSCLSSLYASDCCTVPNLKYFFIYIYALISHWGKPGKKPGQKVRTNL